MRQQYLITQTELPIEEGHTYYIRASHTGYPDVNAICTVPYAREINFRLDTITTQNDQHWGEIWPEEHRDVYAEWTDYPGEENFYMLSNKSIVDSYYYTFDGEEYVLDSITYYCSWWIPYLEDEYGHSATSVRFTLCC